MTHWSQDDEFAMVELVRKGVSLNDIAKKFNKPIEHIEKQLKKIIYENIIGGKTTKAVAALLVLPEEQVDLYFNSYKTYKEQKIKQQLVHQPQQAREKRRGGGGGGSGGGSGSGSGSFDSKAEMIEKENRFIKAILENRRLHHELGTCIQNGGVNKGITQTILDLRKQ